MKATERTIKFNEFLKISQAGVLGSTETALKLGISINTLYNWRKRLRGEKQGQMQKSQPSPLPQPSFSRVAVESARHSSASSFIEITIGNNIVLRVPPQMSADVLHTILGYCRDQGTTTMISFSFPPEIYIANRPTDFRKCFDGLCGEIQSYLHSDPLSGALFVFYNRRRDRLKMIVWDNDGFWMFYKRLEQGTFEIPAVGGEDPSVSVSSEQLHLMLCGIELSSVRKRKRYAMPLCQSSNSSAGNIVFK